MSQSASIWLVIALALLGANAPFLSQRWLLIGPVVDGGKRWIMRVVEMLLMYAAVGVVGLGLERHLGQVAPQGWEFYAVTSALFLTFAFPGFVYRYLWVPRR